MTRSMLFLLLAACGDSGDKLDDDTGRVTCGVGTHLVDGVCEVDVDTADNADSDSGLDSDTAEDTDTGSAETGDTDSGNTDTADTDTGSAVSDYTVCDDGLAPYSSIQDAVNGASDGDTISICAGTYVETVSLSSVSVSLVGEDAETTIIDADHGGSALSITNGQGADTVIRGLTLEHGDADLAGGGLSIEGSSPTVEDLILTDNTARVGGAIALQDSDATLEGLVITYNTTTSSGSGVYAIGGAPMLGHLLIAHNDSAAYGAIYAYGAELWLYNSLIVENSGRNDGAGVYVGGATSSLVFNLVIARNDCVTEGDYAASINSGELYNTIVYDNGICRGLALEATEAYNLSYGHTDCNFVTIGSPCGVTTKDLEADPRFTDAPGGDYTLSALSPGVDAGNPLAGYNDPDGTRNDLGIYGGPAGSW